MDTGKFVEGVLRADSVSTPDNKVQPEARIGGTDELRREQKFLNALWEYSQSHGGRPVKPEEAEKILAEFETVEA